MRATRVKDPKVSVIPYTPAAAIPRMRDLESIGVGDGFYHEKSITQIDPDRTAAEFILKANLINTTFKEAIDKAIATSKATLRPGYGETMHQEVSDEEDEENTKAGDNAEGFSPVKSRRNKRKERSSQG